MAKSFATVKAEAVVIRDEVITNANTATRVGTAMLDTLDTAEYAISQKVSTSDVINNLSSTETTKPLSASQGKVLYDGKVSKTQSVIAGNGLTGGGALSNDVTLNVVATNDSIVVSSDSIKVDTVNNLTSTSITKPLSANQGKVLQDGKVDKTQSIVVGNGLVGGGNLSGNVTIYANTEDNLTSTSTVNPLSANQGKVLNDGKVNKTQSVLAGNGLIGGGTLSGDVTINVAATDDSLVVAADGIKVNTIDTLLSTSATKPLSANQGKVLHTHITQLDAQLSLYRDTFVEFSIDDSTMSLQVNIPDLVTDEFSLNSNGELILTY